VGTGGQGIGGGPGTGGAPTMSVDGPAAAPSDGPSGADANGVEDAQEPGGDGPCMEPAIDGYQLWLASGEGVTRPPKDSILVPEGDHLVGKVEFVGGGWHVVPVHLDNDPDKGSVNLSKSSGFTLTYSATADAFVQLRSAAHWDGGSQYVTAVPGTGGKVVTRTFSFAKASWTVIPNLGVPQFPYETVLPDARALVFIGLGANTLTFTSLKVDGYSPTCRPPRKKG
jgi:hypothetical protein